MSDTGHAAPYLPLSRPRAILLIGALFTFFFSAYVFTASPDIFSTGDTTIRIELAENILGRFSVELHGWTLTYPKHIKKEYIDTRVTTGRDHKTFSTYLLGQPLAIIPFDKLGSSLAVQERWPFGPTVLWVDRLVGPLFGALEVVIFFMFAMRLGYGLGRSLILTVVFAFATPVWPDEQSALEHTEVAFFLLLAMYAAYRFREQRRGSAYLILAGMAIGGAAITRYQDAALGLLGVTVYLMLPGAPARGLWPRVRWLLLGGLGLLPFVVLDLWYNWFRFGSFFATGHHERLFGTPLTVGIPGLLVSPGKGLLWYFPLMFLLVVAVPKFARHYRALSVAVAVMSIAAVVFYAKVTFWHGDPAWGPRYLYPLVPFLTLPLGELLFIRIRKAPALWGLIVLVLMGSFVVQFAGVSVSQWRTWYRVISYEENRGYTWQWEEFRYRYFWNPRESPLYLQLHGLYQLAVDDFLHRTTYQIVPPDEDPVLDNMITTYSLDQWNFWWGSNEFNWWMGERKVIEGMVLLASLMLASGTYLVAEGTGVFARQPFRSSRDESITEAA